MGGVSISIAVDDRAVNAALERLKAAATDLSRPMLEISGSMLEETWRRFDEERDPLGVPWKKSRRAIEDGGKTLFDTGELRRAIVADSGADFAVVGVERTPGLARDDKSVGDYAAIHQFGGTIRPKNGKGLKFGGRVLSQVIMPARPYLGFGEVERNEAIDILGNHLRNAFSGTGNAG